MGFATCASDSHATFIISRMDKWENGRDPSEASSYSWGTCNNTDIKPQLSALELRLVRNTVRKDTRLFHSHMYELQNDEVSIPGKHGTQN